MINWPKIKFPPINLWTTPALDISVEKEVIDSRALLVGYAQDDITEALNGIKELVKLKEFYQKSLDKERIRLKEKNSCITSERGVFMTKHKVVA